MSYIIFKKWILNNQLYLNNLNEKIDMVNNNLNFFIGLISTSVAIAGVAFYFIAKEIVYSTTKKELPNNIKNNPQIESMKGKLDLVPVYNYDINTFRLGKINTAGKNIVSEDDILYLNLYYYESLDLENVELENPSLSSNQLLSLTQSKYKINITKFFTTMEDNYITVEINQENVPKDIYFNIIYKNY